MRVLIPTLILFAWLCQYANRYADDMRFVPAPLPNASFAHAFDYASGEDANSAILELFPEQ